MKLLLGAVAALTVFFGQNWFAYNSVYWDDLRMPANVARVGQGAGTAADIHPLSYLLFDNSSDEEVFYITQMPHGYKLGTDLVAHVHWAKTTSASGDVCFRIDYECADIDEIFTNALGTTLSFAYTVDDGDTAYHHSIAGATLSNPGFSGVSGMCVIRLWRDVSGDGGTCADDYGADAAVYEFDFHYQTDQPGSVGETSKFQ